MLAGIPGYPSEGPWTGLPNDLFGTAFAYASTRDCAKMARVLGRTADAAKYDAQAEQYRAAFQRHFVHTDGTLAGENQTVDVLALYFDLLPDSQRAKTVAHSLANIDHYDGRLSTGIIATPKLLVVLGGAGVADRAYGLLQSRRFPSLGFMIDQGATTVWERWNNFRPEAGLDKSGMTSFNHYALGGMAEWLYRGVLGINRDANVPAYRHFVLRPLPGGTVMWAGGEYDSIRGKISSAWRIADGKLIYDCTVPPNTTATLYLPTADATTVRESGGPPGKSPGVQVIAPTGREFAAALESGAYEFTAEYSR